MRISALLLFAATLASAADPFVPLNVKPGDWETVTTTTTTGKMPVPKELLAKMTPEQRSEFEAARAKEPNSSTRTNTEHRCLSQEDLAKPLSMSDDPGCKTTLTTSTPTKMEGHISCTNSGITMEGSVRAEASTPESIKFTYQLTSGDGTQTMNLSANATAKWTGPSCIDKKD